MGYFFGLTLKLDDCTLEEARSRAVHDLRFVAGMLENEVHHGLFEDDNTKQQIGSWNFRDEGEDGGEPIEEEAARRHLTIDQIREERKNN